MSETKDGLLTKLDELDGRFTEIERQIHDPSVASDPNKIIPLSKEQKKLRPLVERYRQYIKCQSGLTDAEQMLTDPELDEEFRELARQEIEQLQEQKDRLIDQIKDTLVMAEDSTVDSVIVEIRPGTGGDEASLFARDLYQMYNKYAERKGWKVEVLSFSPTELGGLREAILNIKGSGVWSYLGYEGGGHRVQRVPETESQGRVHTSAATVAVLPEPEEVDIEINPDEVVEHVSRAGGPGGQNVNKVSSAIKLEHIPTGITVSMRDEKSQHKNRAKAWRILRSRLYDHFQSKLNAQRDSARKTMIGSGDRSQRIRTYNFPQNRLTDHRINVSLYSLDKIILGDLDELVEALIAHDKAERLRNL
ncbi:MAG: peptide chain release factor 1 [Sedimentisphaerales bacterium]|nr:peptide chain release factor 1 [Sedimentisphaerales bacterium]